MRSSITLIASLSLTAALAQESGTGAQVASVVPRPVEAQRTSRWSGSGRVFRAGQPIEPVSMRVITWEFGDGSLSHILPPRPWRPADGVAERRTWMAPYREHHGGSACVGPMCAALIDEGPGEPRAQVIIENGLPVLVTTGLGVMNIGAGSIDPVSGNGTFLTGRYTSGRWAFGSTSDPEHPHFIILQDLSTGERWRAGVDL